MSDLMADLSTEALDHLGAAGLVLADKVPAFGTWLAVATHQERRRRAGEDFPPAEVPLYSDRQERHAVVFEIIAMTEAIKNHLGLTRGLIPVELFAPEDHPMMAEVHDWYSDLGQCILAAARPANNSEVH